MISTITTTSTYSNTTTTIIIINIVFLLCCSLYIITDVIKNKKWFALGFNMVFSIINNFLLRGGVSYSCEYYNSAIAQVPMNFTSLQFEQESREISHYSIKNNYWFEWWWNLILLHLALSICFPIVRIL